MAAETVSRRNLMTACLAWLMPWRYEQPVEHERPWASYVDALDAREGYSAWNELSGWEQWIEHEADKLSLGNGIIGALDIEERVTLYTICRKLADGENHA